MIRFFIKFISVMSFIAVLCLAYGFFIEPKRLVIKQYDVPLTAPLERPLKIGIISDIHIAGQHMPPSRVENIVSRLNDFDLDMVLIAGDFINGHMPRTETSDAFDAKIDEGIKALKQLKTPYGSLAVIGNHDVWYDPAYVEKSLEAAHVSVLTNEAINITPAICIVGLADNLTQTEDPNSFAQCAPKSFIIALMHSPDSFKYLRSDVGLAIAGHTHGGQINIPFFGRLSTITQLGPNYKQGMKTFNGIAVYISAGLGTSVLPARFRAPPEITLLTLQPSEFHAQPSLP